MFACNVDNDNSNTNKSFDVNDDGNNNQYDESPSSKERKTEMNPSKSLLSILSFFSLSLYRVLFFLSGLVVVARSKLSSSFFSSSIVRHFAAYMRPFLLQFSHPTDESVVLSFCTLSSITDEKKKKARRKEERKNTGKKL